MAGDTDSPVTIWSVRTLGPESNGYVPWSVSLVGLWLYVDPAFKYAAFDAVSSWSMDDGVSVTESREKVPIDGIALGVDNEIAPNRNVEIESDVAQTSLDEASVKV